MTVKTSMWFGAIGVLFGVLYGYMGVFAEGFQPYFTVDYFWQIFPNNTIAVIVANAMLWTMISSIVGHIYGLYKNKS